MPQADNADSRSTEFLLGIEDVSCVVADALSLLGIGGAMGLPGIFPFGSRKRVCGPAFTVRCHVDGADDSRGTRRRDKVGFDFRTLFSRAQPGDVALFDCPVPDSTAQSAVLGSNGAAWARHFSMAGCVVNGAVRDVEALATGGIPVWARHVTPLAARGSLVPSEAGSPVLLGGTPVSPGDILVADGNGVAVIPAGSLAAVVRMVADLHQAEAAASATERT